MRRDGTIASPQSGESVNARPTDETQPRSSMLARATTLLELIASQPSGIGVRDAARRTGIDRSAVSRILTHFEEIGYVHQSGERGDYFAGPRLFSFAASLAARDTLARAAAPFLDQLVAQFNENCYLAVRVDDNVVLRSKVECDHTIRYVLELGKPLPLVGGAAGMAVLSGLEDAELERVLTAPFTVNTPSSFRTADEVRKQVAIDRELGYTYSPGRWVPNGAGIAAPVRDGSGTCIGAITMSMPIDRLAPDHVPVIGEAIATTGRELSSRIGYRPEAPAAATS